MINSLDRSHWWRFIRKRRQWRNKDKGWHRI